MDPQPSRFKQVLVLSTAMLSFISFWKAASVVLCDMGSSAFYAGGIAMNAFGPAFPWYVLAVMIFSGLMLMIYVESCAMFVRGGVYKVVNEAMGHSIGCDKIAAGMLTGAAQAGAFTSPANVPLGDIAVVNMFVSQ